MRALQFVTATTFYNVPTLSKGVTEKKVCVWVTVA